MRFCSFCWSIINLQGCVCFKCTKKWFSYMHTHTHTHSFPDFFFIIDYYKILSIVPCAISRSFYLLFTCVMYNSVCVCVNPELLISLSPIPHPNPPPTPTIHSGNCKFVFFLYLSHFCHSIFFNWRIIALQNFVVFLSHINKNQP